MKLFQKTATTEIWHDTRADEYYCYAGVKLLRVSPSPSHARAVVAGY